MQSQVTQERRFYISSLVADPERLAKAARQHWGIESQVHWRLDVAFADCSGQKHLTTTRPPPGDRKSRSCLCRSDNQVVGTDPPKPREKLAHLA